MSAQEDDASDPEHNPVRPRPHVSGMADGEGMEIEQEKQGGGEGEEEGGRPSSDERRRRKFGEPRRRREVTGGVRPVVGTEVQQ